MSFRSRLTLFFVLIVVVPMVSVTVVIFSLIDDNEQGKANAGIKARQDAATNLALVAVSEADTAAKAVGSDRRLAAGLRAHDRAAVQRRAATLAASLRLQRLLIYGTDKHAIADVGRKDAILPATRQLEDHGTPVGTLQVSVQSGAQYVKLIKEVSDLQVAVRRRGFILASTVPGVTSQELPTGQGNAKIGGHTYRATTFPLHDFRGGLLQVSLLRDQAKTSSSVDNRRLYVGAILLGFFFLAFIFAVTVSRSLQAQVASFLQAARRLGGGEFDTKVPTVGNDEFAALGQEFNTMAAQLEERLGELREERTRVERSMRRLGEALASNLDRDALLGIVVETAVDGVGADGGRASAQTADQGLRERVSAGRLVGLEQVLAAVESQAAETGNPTEATHGEASALAQPLHSTDGSPVVLG